MADIFGCCCVRFCFIMSSQVAESHLIVGTYISLLFWPLISMVVGFRCRLVKLKLCLAFFDGRGFRMSRASYSRALQLGLGSCGSEIDSILLAPPRPRRFLGLCQTLRSAQPRPFRFLRPFVLRPPFTNIRLNSSAPAKVCRIHNRRLPNEGLRSPDRRAQQQLKV